MTMACLNNMMTACLNNMMTACLAAHLVAARLPGIPRIYPRIYPRICPRICPAYLSTYLPTYLSRVSIHVSHGGVSLTHAGGREGRRLRLRDKVRTRDIVPACAPVL
jgi:hypothetical protein